MPEMTQPMRLLIAFVTASAAMPALAETPPGKADPNSVVPSGARNASSGAQSSWNSPIHDNAIHQYSAIDRLEYGTGNALSSCLWDAKG